MRAGRRKIRRWLRGPVLPLWLMGAAVMAAQIAIPKYNVIFGK